tara:strand:+ start:181 stop:426 length:246 start_codon:yes stop_codon:yes gene_type:complete
MRAACVRPKISVAEVEAVNSIEVTFTKADLGEMLNAMDNAYNLMTEGGGVKLKMEGSLETGTFWDVSCTSTESGSTTPFYN